MPDYVYHDRKMMKWMPFNALIEQGDYIRDLLMGRERIEQPVLSPDQEEELNRQLETAYLFGYMVQISYYESYQIKQHTGTITQIDVHNKLLFVDDKSIEAQRITGIEII